MILTVWNDLHEKMEKEVLTKDRWQVVEEYSFKHDWTFIEGAVRSGKTVAGCHIFADHIIDCDLEGEALFLAGGVSESMAKALIGENAGFGLFYYFKSLEKYGVYVAYRNYKSQSALYIKLRKHGKVYIRWVIFAGGAKARCDEAIRGLTLQGAYFVEANLLTKDFILEAERRTLISHNKFLICDMNPAMTKHFIYCDFIDNPKIDSVHIHATLIDNLALPEGEIERIQARYDHDSVQYKGYILGERMNPAGAIYRVKDYNILQEFKVEDYQSYVISCDQGETISATSITLNALKYHQDKGIYSLDTLKEYHHINGEEVEKHFADYANDLVKFFKESEKLMGYQPERVIIDQNEEFYYQVVVAFQKNGIDPFLVKYPYKLEIAVRVKYGVEFMYAGKLRFYRECTNTIEDFKNAEYDTKEIERKHVFVRAKNYIEGVGHLDMVDGVEYAFTYYLDYLVTEDIE